MAKVARSSGTVLFLSKTAFWLDPASTPSGWANDLGGVQPSPTLAMVFDYGGTPLSGPLYALRRANVSTCQAGDCDWRALELV